MRIWIAAAAAAVFALAFAAFSSLQPLSTRGGVQTNIRRAMVYGSVVASFCCEGFGLSRTTRVKSAEIEKRVEELERLTRF